MDICRMVSCVFRSTRQGQEGGGREGWGGDCVCTQGTPVSSIIEGRVKQRSGWKIHRIPGAKSLALGKCGPKASKRRAWI